MNIISSISRAISNTNTSSCSDIFSGLTKRVSQASKNIIKSIGDAYFNISCRISAHINAKKISSNFTDEIKLFFKLSGDNNLLIKTCEFIIKKDIKMKDIWQDLSRGSDSDIIGFIKDESSDFEDILYASKNILKYDNESISNFSSKMKLRRYPSFNHTFTDEESTLSDITANIEMLSEPCSGGGRNAYRATNRFRHLLYKCAILGENTIDRKNDIIERIETSINKGLEQRKKLIKDVENDEKKIKEKARAAAAEVIKVRELKGTEEYSQEEELLKTKKEKRMKKIERNVKREKERQIKIKEEIEKNKEGWLDFFNKEADIYFGTKEEEVKKRYWEMLEKHKKKKPGYGHTAFSERFNHNKLINFRKTHEAILKEEHPNEPKPPIFFSLDDDWRRSPYFVPDFRGIDNEQG